MDELERIEDQLKRAHEGVAWHGPHLQELLSGIKAEQALAKPIANTHSIWEIVYHIATWENVVRLRLIGETPEVPDEENFPTIADKSEEAWQETLTRLGTANRQLRQAVLSADENRLNDPIMSMEGMPTTYRTLHGAVEHTLYHAGQIALIKNALFS